MKVRLAKRIGFCFGVKRAVAMAEKALEDNKEISSLGSLIHNEQVVSGLAKKGLKVVKGVGNIRGGAVVISSHGLSPKTSKEIAKRGIKIIDTTCPFVLNAQRIARHLSEEDYSVVIVGDSNHPEVKALVDFAAGKVIVVRDSREAGRLNLKGCEKIGVISQTTQSPANFLDVVKVVLEKRPKEIKIFNTICNDAEERQRLASLLSRQVDLMLVVGGRDSANTKRLFEVCRKILKNTHLIETEKGLEKGWFKKGQVVGITSGASTPDWIIKKVVDRIKDMKARKGSEIYT